MIESKVLPQIPTGNLIFLGEILNRVGIINKTAGFLGRFSSLVVFNSLVNGDFINPFLIIMIRSVIRPIIFVFIIFRDLL